MQWLIDLIIESIGIPPVFIDRGDPAVADWDQDDLTRDGAWHELDISAIVPENASAVLIGGFVRDNAIGKFIGLRKSGNANVYATSGLYTQVANTWIQQDFIVATSPDEKIEYNVPAGFDFVVLTVRGWWL